MGIFKAPSWLSAWLGTVLVMAWLAPAQVDAQPIQTISGCRARVVRPAKQQVCISCIQRGGVFYKRGADVGACRMPSAPVVRRTEVSVRQPTPELIQTRHGCESRIARAEKRMRCHVCVRRGGAFDRQGPGLGACVMPSAPPPPVVVAPRGGEGDVIDTLAGCAERIARAPKRRRCRQCLRHGGVFERDGAAGGVCLPADHSPLIGTPVGCANRIARASERRRCLGCVRHGGVFDPRGPGGCALADRAVIEERVRTAAGCSARIVREPKRLRCIACVQRGGVFHKQGASAGFCAAR